MTTWKSKILNLLRPRRQIHKQTLETTGQSADWSAHSKESCARAKLEAEARLKLDDAARESALGLTEL